MVAWCPSNRVNSTMRFGIPWRTHVGLVVYDLAGRHVKTLVDGMKEPGWYEIRWDGRNRRGDRVASGVYFCRLEAGGSKASRKVVVLK